MGFSRQEYCSGLPFPSPGDLPNPRTEPISLRFPALAGMFFNTSTTWEALRPIGRSHTYPKPIIQDAPLLINSLQLPTRGGLKLHPTIELASPLPAFASLWSKRDGDWLPWEGQLWINRFCLFSVGWSLFPQVGVQWHKVLIFPWEKYRLFLFFFSAWGEQSREKN